MASQRTTIVDVRVEITVPRSWDEDRLDSVIEEIEWIDWAGLVNAKLASLELSAADLAEIICTEGG